MERAATDRKVREDGRRLLAALLAGDQAAGQRFVRRYSPTIEHSVRRVFSRSGLPSSDDDVSDMVSEVWVTLFENDRRSLRRYRPDRRTQLGSWIGLLARRRTIDRIRVSRARRAQLQRQAPAITVQSGDSPTPCEQVEHRERRHLAERAMSALKEEDRAFLRALYVDERAPQEVATQLGVALSTVYTRRFKLQKKLERLVGRLDVRAEVLGTAGSCRGLAA